MRLQAFPKKGGFGDKQVLQTCGVEYVDSENAESGEDIELQLAANAAWRRTKPKDMAKGGKYSKCETICARRAYHLQLTWPVYPVPPQKKQSIIDA